MGLLNFIKSFFKEKVDKASLGDLKITSNGETITFTHRAHDNIFSDVDGITNSEKIEIINLISNEEGEFKSINNHHQEIYEKYFKGRVWSWGEYEYWTKRFSEYGRYPTNFFIKQGRLSNKNALDLLKVAELKSLLDEKGIPFKAKDRKPELIDLAMGIPNIDRNEVLISKLEAYLEKERFEIYTILMRTISFRDNSLSTYKKARSVGINEFEITHIFENDIVFAEMALTANPEALPPLYPYDLSFLRPITNFEKSM